MLKVAFQIADHTIQFDEDYYRSQKWRRAISESMKAHYSQAAGLALADKALELLSLQEPIVDLQAQANDPGGNSRRDFGNGIPSSIPDRIVMTLYASSSPRQSKLRNQQTQKSGCPSRIVI